MRAVIQRVKQAAVTIDNHTVGEIKQGLLIFLGVHETDTMVDVAYLVKKITQMRIFEDEDHKMNLSVQDIAGDILSVSQFTLYAETKKGNRPSFVKAARPEIAKPLYHDFNKSLAHAGLTVATGKFGADMQVSLMNDGPVTIIIDTLDK